MKTKHIKSFIFGLAKYRLTDGQNFLILEIDYQHNLHRIKWLKGSNPNMEQEASEIAADLLKRKHGVNFAES